MMVSKTKAFMNKTITSMRAALALFCLSILLRIENAERNHPINSAIKKRLEAIKYKYPSHLKRIKKRIFGGNVSLHELIGFDNEIS